MAKLKSPTEIGGMPIIPEGATPGDALTWDGAAYVPLPPSGAGSFLPLAGGTMTGFITLHAAPTADFHAANKKYVVDQIAAVAHPYLPLGGGTMTGEILGLGVVATPAFSFSGDPDTGMFRVGVNTIGFSTGGTEVMRLGTDLVMAGGTGAPYLKGSPGNAALPGFTFNGDTDTGLYRSATNTVDVTVAGAHIWQFNGANDAVGSAGANFAAGFPATVQIALSTTLPALHVTRAGGNAVYFGRNTSNGDVVTFWRSGTSVGTISVTTTATAYGTSSDARLKKNIRDFRGGLDVLGALRPRVFEWKRKRGETPEPSDMGFVAQEIRDVIPGLVTESDDGFLMLDYGRLTPWIVAAVRELAEKVDRLENT